jgi:hypothetical protein
MDRIPFVREISTRERGQEKDKLVLFSSREKDREGERSRERSREGSGRLQTNRKLLNVRGTELDCPHFSPTKGKYENERTREKGSGENWIGKIVNHHYHLN